MQPKQYGIFSLPVIVGALGFFIDITGAWVTGIIILAISIYSVIKTKETFAKDLDFVEL